MNQQQRTVYQPTVLVGAIGAMLFAACPPLGLPILILAFVMHRSFTWDQKAHLAAQQRRAQERAAEVRVMALKSLR
jgi:hypothetical protein